MQAARNLEKRFSLDSISSRIIARHWDQEQLDQLDQQQQNEPPFDTSQPTQSHLKYQRPRPRQRQRRTQDLGQSLRDQNQDPSHILTHILDQNSPESSQQQEQQETQNSLSRNYNCHCTNSPCDCFVLLTKKIDMLQKDLNVAVEVGQALLKTHEDYVAESQAEAAQMEESINSMTLNLQSVMRENDKLLVNNSELISQLHENSKALQESDSKIEKLSHELNSSKDRIIRLNTFMLQAKELEAQISSLEMIRQGLQDDLQQTEREKQLAELKWRKAERLLEKLTDQYEKLEEESVQSQKPTASRLAFLNDQSIKKTISDLQKNVLGANERANIPATSTPVKYKHETWSANTSSQQPQFPMLISPPSSGKRGRSHLRNSSKSTLNGQPLGPLYEDESFREFFGDESADSSFPYYSSNQHDIKREYVLSSPLHSRQNSCLANEYRTASDNYGSASGKDSPLDSSSHEPIRNTVEFNNGLPTPNDTLEHEIDLPETQTSSDDINHEERMDESINQDSDRSVTSNTESVESTPAGPSSPTDSIKSSASTATSIPSSALTPISPRYEPMLRRAASHESIFSVFVETHLHNGHSRNSSTTTAAIDLSPALGPFSHKGLPSFYSQRTGVALAEISTEMSLAPPSKLLNPEYSNSQRSRQLLFAAISNNTKQAVKIPARRNSIESSTTSDLSGSSDQDRPSSSWASLFSRLRNPTSTTNTTPTSTPRSPADTLIAKILADPIQTHVLASPSDVSEAMNSTIL
ncbi:hypothetical protein AWJ20_2179 [Sugiyamaella lignohabitans]|uniref:Uncharacterized protein n=1 Tax=Sugiyamaella lignohabitans TaxID=796027 RepID=A0A167EXN4_9ASCO|nr:uncharacterized protein AWJ20_2179 [Sugiyamaella lignohabitans]ANB14579.1 hypothetical protein AWJ20_2179 [Sugiyamaella lignohabitans]